MLNSAQWLNHTAVYALKARKIWFSFPSCFFPLAIFDTYIYDLKTSKQTTTKKKNTPQKKPKTHNPNFYHTRTFLPQ